MLQEKEEVYVALQHAASFHCLVEEWKDCEELKPKPREKWIFVDGKREETKHRTEWCPEADRYRCMLTHTRSLAKGVTISSEYNLVNAFLVVVNVHLEPDLILRNLCERLRLIAFT